MRHFAVLFLVILASLHAKPQVPVNAGVQAKGSSNHENQPDSKIQQRSPAISPNPVDSSQTRKSNSDQESRNGQRDSNDRAYRVNIESQPTSGWTIAYVIITAVLGLLGAGTLWVLIYQTTTLREQVRLQERGLRQWVNTGDWQSGFTDMRTPTGERVLEIVFEVSNVTKAPITIILIKADTDGPKSIGGRVEFPQNAMLLPETPIRCRLWVPLTHEQQNGYIADGALIHIGGTILYSDALEETWEQGFRLVLIGSATGTRPENYFHTVRKVHRVQIVQSPPPRWRRAVDWWMAQVEAMKNGESKND